jgi:hypothetical protein
MSNRWKGGFIQAYFDPLTTKPVRVTMFLLPLKQMARCGHGGIILLMAT